MVADIAAGAVVGGGVWTVGSVILSLGFTFSFVTIVAVCACCQCVRKVKVPNDEDKDGMSAKAVVGMKKKDSHGNGSNQQVSINMSRLSSKDAAATSRPLLNSSGVGASGVSQSRALPSPPSSVPPPVRFSPPLLSKHPLPQPSTAQQDSLTRESSASDLYATVEKEKPIATSGAAHIFTGDSGGAIGTEKHVYSKIREKGSPAKTKSTEPYHPPFKDGRGFAGYATIGGDSEAGDSLYSKVDENKNTQSASSNNASKIAGFHDISGRTGTDSSFRPNNERVYEYPAFPGGLRKKMEPPTSVNAVQKSGLEGQAIYGEGSEDPYSSIKSDSESSGGVIKRKYKDNIAGKEEPLYEGVGEVSSTTSDDYGGSNVDPRYAVIKDNGKGSNVPLLNRNNYPGASYGPSGFSAIRQQQRRMGGNGELSMQQSHIDEQTLNDELAIDQLYAKIASRRRHSASGTELPEGFMLDQLASGSSNYPPTFRDSSHSSRTQHDRASAGPSFPTVPEKRFSRSEFRSGRAEITNPSPLGDTVRRAPIGNSGRDERTVYDSVPPGGVALVENNDNIDRSGRQEERFGSVAVGGEERGDGAAREPPYRYITVRESLETVRARIQDRDRDREALRQQQIRTQSDPSLHYYCSISEHSYEVVPGSSISGSGGGYRREGDGRDGGQQLYEEVSFADDDRDEFGQTISSSHIPPDVPVPNSARRAQVHNRPGSHDFGKSVMENPSNEPFPKSPSTTIEKQSRNTPLPTKQNGNNISERGSNARGYDRIDDSKRAAYSADKIPEPPTSPVPPPFPIPPGKISPGGTGGLGSSYIMSDSSFGTPSNTHFHDPNYPRSSTPLRNTSHLPSTPLAGHENRMETSDDRSRKFKTPIAKVTVNSSNPPSPPGPNEQKPHSNNHPTGEKASATSSAFNRLSSLLNGEKQFPAGEKHKQIVTVAANNETSQPTTQTIHPFDKEKQQSVSTTTAGGVAFVAVNHDSMDYDEQGRPKNLISSRAPRVTHSPARKLDQPLEIGIPTSKLPAPISQSPANSRSASRSRSKSREKLGARDSPKRPGFGSSSPRGLNPVLKALDTEDEALQLSPSAQRLLIDTPRDTGKLPTERTVLVSPARAISLSKSFDQQLTSNDATGETEAKPVSKSVGSSPQKTPKAPSAATADSLFAKAGLRPDRCQKPPTAPPVTTANPMFASVPSHVQRDSDTVGSRNTGSLSVPTASLPTPSSEISASPNHASKRQPPVEKSASNLKDVKKKPSSKTYISTTAEELEASGFGADLSSGAFPKHGSGSGGDGHPSNCFCHSHRPDLKAVVKENVSMLEKSFNRSGSAERDASGIFGSASSGGSPFARDGQTSASAKQQLDAKVESAYSYRL